MMHSSESPSTAILIGDTPIFSRMVQQLHRVAASEATVLVEGETGTGKELVAHAIHNLSGLLQSALKRGKRLLRLSNPGVFVYMRHGRNAWKECKPGRFLKPAEWERVARPSTVPASVLASYHAAVVGQ
jgi:sigma-54 interacting transcriptional regulator